MPVFANTKAEGLVSAVGRRGGAFSFSGTEPGDPEESPDKGGDYTPPVPRPPQFNWRCILCQTILPLVTTYENNADELEDLADLAEEAGNAEFANELRDAASEWDREAEEGRQALATGNCGHPEECGI